MEIFRTLGALVEPPSVDQEPLAKALGLGDLPSASEHSELFVFQLYPYASVYLGPEGMMGGEARDRVAGFWRALGQSPPNEPDHLTVLLATYAELCEHDQAGKPGHAGKPGQAEESGWRRARRAFLWEHLISWLALYLDRFAKEPEGFYRQWAALLTEALKGEVDAMGPLDREALCFRDAIGLADPREEGSEALIRSLLAPARCGMILTRDDLRRAGSELELGVRAGERRFVLENLLGQDPKSVLTWLADQVSSQSDLSSCWGSAAEIWGRRRDAAADLLAELAGEAHVSTGD